jgi:uncharacterized protein (DUF736 family)
MATIGRVARRDDGSFIGFVKTSEMKRPVNVTIVPLEGPKKSDKHPDFRVEIAGGNEAGAAWKKIGKKGPYISVTFEEPVFGPMKLYCNIGQTEEEKEAGSDEFNLIWNARTA